MFELYGNYSNAKIFQDRENVEEECVKQIQAMLDSESAEGSDIRIMPDLHAGAGCCIGFTQKLADRVVPNLVGVDIGCGMLVAKFDKAKVDKLFGCREGLKRLDKIWRQKIPMGMNHRQNVHPFADNVHLENIKAPVNKDKLLYSIGTLGGGNHFGELDKDEEGNYYLVIHSGSRHLGLEVARHHQNLAKEILASEGNDHYGSVNLAYLKGERMEDYLNDMKWSQEYAYWNREAMLEEIVDEFKLKKAVVQKFHTIHNYIDTENRIVRKGAISLEAGELAIIPMNMRDGSLIVIGKGNEDWNYSGPHGAGRVLSRTAARNQLKMEDFKSSMKDVFTTSVSIATLDESPMAYRPMDQIVKNIGDTCDVVGRIIPIWNIKAGDDE